MLHAMFVTPSSRQWLASTATARVLNKFERACNLINQDDDILALVTSELGLTPFAIVIAAVERLPFREVSDSSAVRVEADRLIVEPLEINLASAAVWNPVPDWSALRQHLSDSPGRLRELSDIALELAVKGSLLDLYRSTEPLSGREEGMDRPLLERARAGATALVSGLRRGSMDECIEGARKLAGLGGGLTPSGDDFIVGAILAAWAGLFGAGRAAMAGAIVETAARLTTTLSGAYLRAAARGECIAYWHRMLASLSGTDKEVIRMAAKSLMSIGHSSGADALAGFLAAEQFSSA